MKLICKEIEILLALLIFSLCITSSNSKNLLTDMNKLKLESASEILKLETDQIYQTVPLPKGISNMLLAYTYIFPDDTVKDVTLDSVKVEDGEILIYKPSPDGETTKIIISLKELSWLCGKSLLCKPDEAAEKLNPTGKLQKINFTDAIKQLYKKLGPDSTNCVADEYMYGIIQKAIIFCFKSSAKEVEFSNFFSGLDKKDTAPAAILPFDISKTETHLLSFSDGRDALLELEVSFKEDGLYDKSDLLFKYSELENIDNQKCQVKYRLPIAPANFLKNKIFNTNCIARIKYNRLDTYIGSGTSNCEEVMKYVITRMKKKCLAMKDGPTETYKSVLQNSKVVEAEWKGMIFYHKILEEKNEVTKLMFKLFISPEKVTILNKDGHEIRVVELQNLKWPCNNDGACSIPEYLRLQQKLGKKIVLFKQLQKDMLTQWQIQDLNSCYILNEEFDHIICPSDNAEELNMRLSLSIGLDKLYHSQSISNVKPAPIDSEFNIIWAAETDTTFKDYTVLVTTQGLKDKKEKTNLMEYRDIEKIQGISCAFIMRKFALPNSFHEFDSNCCAKYQAKEIMTFCIQKKSKCYMEIRKMVNLMRENCLKVLKESKDIAGTPDSPIDTPQTSAKELTTTAFKGEVVYTPLGNHKFKGQAITHTGTVEINSNKITFISQGVPHFQYPIVTVRLLCKSEFICSAENYLKNQKPHLNQREFEWLDNHTTNFFNGNKTIQKSGCSVIIATNAEFNVSEGVIVCSPSGQGEQIKASVTNSNADALSKLTEDHPLLKQIPEAPIKTSFSVEIVSAARTDDIQKAQSTKTKILNKFTGIKYLNINEFIVEYKEVYDPDTFKVNTIFNLEEKNVPVTFINKKIAPRCCFQITTSANVIVICMLSGKRCVYDKAQLYLSMKNAAKRMADTQRKKKEISQMMESEKGLERNKFDEFNFWLPRNFRKFSEGFSFITLSSETVYNVEAGMFKGWIYSDNLTNRDYKRKILPIHMTLQDGVIEFRYEQSQKPYLKLNLKHFDSVCSKPCMPKEYLKAVQEINSVADKVYLNKCITNFMGQIFKPFSEEACSIIDFKHPTIEYGTSIILCTIEELQGKLLRAALNVGIYTSFRNLDIENGVKSIGWQIDKFYGILIINDSIDTKFNEFTTNKKGLVGSKQGNLDKFYLDYDKIRKDNYGNVCAMWYKNIKVMERGQEFEDAVKDNNCCFRFYYGAERKKIEICVFVPGNGLCVKQSRELMKSLKEGCVQNGGTPMPDDKTKKKDEYSEEIFDDAPNGIFKGYIYISDAFKPSQIPSDKPKYIKIRKKAIQIYSSMEEEKAEIELKVDTLLFNCEGYAPCNPKDFITYAGTNKDYIPNLAAVTAVFNNYKVKYPKLIKTFDQDCFILETKEISYIACPYNPSHASSIKKAIVEAFSLSYSCKTLMDVTNTKPDEVFNLVIKGEKPKETIQGKINGKGLVNLKDNTQIFEYLAMGADPETKKRCAIWFKDLDIPFEFEHKECCFNLLINNKNLIICLEEKGICISHTFQLMRSIYNGCLYGLTNMPQSTDDPKQRELLGDSTNYVPPKKFEFDKNTMFYNIQVSKRKKSFFKDTAVKSDYLIDPDNRHMFSITKTSFTGYFNVYPIDFEKESQKPLQHLYGVLHGEHMKFYNSRVDKEPVLDIHPHFLSMSCGYESACSPKQFGDFIVKFDKKYDNIKDNIEKKMVMFESNNDDGCAILEYTLKNAPKYYILCIHVTNVRSSVESTEIEIEKQSYIPGRNMVSSLYGKALRKILFNSNTISRKFVDNFVLPVDLEPLPQGKITVVENGTKLVNDIAITPDGVTTAGQLVFKFADAVHCRVRTNLLYVPEQVRTSRKELNRSCCIRFMGSKNQEYLCAETFNCEYSIFHFARQFNERCSAKRGRHYDDIYNEVNSISFKLLPFLKKFVTADLKVLDIEKINVGPNALPVDNFKTKFKTILVNIMYRMRMLYHDIAVSQITNGKPTTQGEVDNTPLDDPKEPIKEKVVFYKGESTYFNLEVIKGRVMSYVEKEGGRNVLSLNKMLFLRDKDYAGIVFDESKSIVISFSEDNTKFFFELDTSGNMLLSTNWDKLSQKSQSASEAFSVLGGELRGQSFSISSTSAITSSPESSSPSSSSPTTTTTITSS